MENKINIAELLKDCPKGMELDCALYDNVFFDGIDTNNDYFPISLYYKHNNIKTGFSVTKYGTYINHQNTKCIIFPKGKTTWEGFQKPFEDGDVVISNMGDIHLLRTKDSSYCAYRESWGLSTKFDETTTHVKVVRLATEEEKEKLFQTIKDNGYKWNEGTKTLEKLVIPKFKVGDVIQDIDTYKVKITEVNIEDECYGYESMIAKGIGSISFSEQDNWELVPNKFDITTLKPFDKVLIRQTNFGKWGIDFFGFYNKGYYYTTSNCEYMQCVPYEGNEHLVGTTNDCDKYYKNWE